MSLTTPTQTPAAWPEGVTARIVTRAGILIGSTDATVDIHDNQADHTSIARCRGCGSRHPRPLMERRKAVKWAQQHADQCTGLPKPTQNSPVITPAIHHSH